MRGRDWVSDRRRLKLYWFFILVVALGALVLRAPRLSLRPMHTDEAVHADNFHTLLQGGAYTYDPREYHGPTLNYFTLIPAWLASARSYADLTEVMLRIVPVVFGTILVLLTLLLVDGLGPAAVWAAVFAALSPALVFYSRYYIQEMLLVCFTFGVIVCGYRYFRARTLPWAVATGIFAGLMHATKETCIIAFASMGLALVLMALAQLGKGRRFRQVTAGVKPLHLLLGVVVAIGVSALFYSSFLRHPRGVLDSYLTYATYLSRGAGENTVHVHPWYYYLQMILFVRYFHGPVWTEGGIVLLALVGMAAAVKAIPASSLVPESGGPGWQRQGRGPWQGLAADMRATPDSSTNSGEALSLQVPPGRSQATSQPFADSLREDFAGRIDGRLVCFLALYTLTMTVVYSAVRYKTPWCMLSFLHGLILLAGVGAATLLAWARKPALRTAVVVGVVAIAGYLAFEAYRASFVYYADSRNPYVYAHPTMEIFTIVDKVKAYVGVHGLGQSDEVPIQVAVPGKDYWPLPWYLRAYHVGYSTEIPEEVGPLILISDTLERTLAKRLYEDTPRKKQRMYMYLFDPPYYLWFRPGVKMLGFVRNDFQDELADR
jgi:uncharacterized protein (TIGR03663 family)